MKRSIILVVMAGGIFLLFQAFNLNREPQGEIPEEVISILQSSCFDCHTSGSRNKDAREALNFETWDDLRATKKIGSLGKINEMVEENKMPPAKYLEYNPEKKLTEAQKKLILDWATEESSVLMEGE